MGRSLFRKKMLISSAVAAFFSNSCPPLQAAEGPQAPLGEPQASAVHFFASKGLDPDQDVRKNFEALLALIPQDAMNDAPLEAVHELSEHFGYDFWNDLHDSHYNIFTVVQLINAPDRVALVHELNNILRPSSGRDKEKRSQRATLIQGFHRMDKYARLQRLVVSRPLLLNITAPFLAAKGLALDQNVRNNFEELLTYFPQDTMNGAILEAVYELSEHFAYNFWHDEYDTGHNIFTLLKDSNEPDRLGLVRELNYVFRPLPGGDKEKRRQRDALILCFLRIDKYARLQRLAVLKPLLLNIAENCQDHYEVERIFRDIYDLTSNYLNEELATFVTDSLFVLTILRSTKGQREIMRQIQFGKTPVRVAQFFSAKGVVPDQDVFKNFGDLLALFPPDTMNDATLEAIHELSEHFGYNFWGDKDYSGRSEVYDSGHNISTLIQDSNVPDRLGLVHELNNILRPLSGRGKEKRIERANLIQGFHRIDKYARLQRLAVLKPLLLNVAEDCQDHDEIRSVFYEIPHLASHYLDEQLATFVTDSLSILTAVRPTKGQRVVMQLIERSAVKSDPSGANFQEALPHILPFLVGNQEIYWGQANIIKEILAIPEPDRARVVQHSLPFKEQYYPEIISCIARMSPDVRESLIPLIVHLRDRLALSEFVVQTLLEGLAKVSPTQWGPLSASIEQLVREAHIEGAAMANLLKEYTKLSVTQWGPLSARIVQIAHEARIEDYEYYDLIPQLAKIAEDDWEGALRQALHLNRTSQNMKISEALACVLKISPELCDAVIEKYGSFLTAHGGRLTHGIYGAGKLFPMIAALPIEGEGWKHIVDHAMPFAVLTSSSSTIAEIMRTFKEAPIEKLPEIAASLEPLKKYLKWCNVFKITEGLTLDDMQQIPDIVEAMIGDLNSEDHQVLELLGVASKIPANERVATLRFAIPYMKELKGGIWVTIPYARHCFLKGVARIPYTDMSRVMKHLHPLLSRLQKNHVYVTAELRDLPREDLPAVVRLSELLGVGRHDGMEVSAIIRSILRWPVAERASLAEFMERYARLVHPDCGPSLVSVLRLIPQALRGEILAQCAPILASQSYGQDAFLSSVASFSPEEIAVYLRDLQVDPSGDGSLDADIIRLMYSTDYFRTEVDDQSRIRGKFISFLTSLQYQGNLVFSLDGIGSRIRQIPRDAVGKHQGRDYFMTMLEFLPMESLERSLDALTLLKERDRVRFDRLGISHAVLVDFLRSQGTIDMDLMIQLWDDFLRTSPNTARVKRLADFITRNYDFFALFEGDDIVQAAIRAGIALENSEDPLNPYNLYKTLVQKRSEVINWDRIVPATETMGGIQARYNPRFLSIDLPQYGLTVAQLPRYFRSFLSDSIAALDTRVQAAPELNGRIIAQTTKSYEDLKDLSLRDGALERHLAFVGDASEKVPVITARFIAIISYLQTLSAERSPGDAFSPQEIGLLGLLASIQGCPNGKSEGINAYYLNMLPAANRYSAVVVYGDDDLGYLRSKNEVTTILLEEIEKMFSGQNHLMKTIVGIEPNEEVQQASHQAGYLRNLIGHAVGLPDQLSFDAHVQTLYANLVQISKQDALEAFWRFFLPHDFIDRIKTKYHLEDAEAIKLLADMGVIEAQGAIAES